MAGEKLGVDFSAEFDREVGEGDARGDDVTGPSIFLASSVRIRCRNPLTERSLLRSLNRGVVGVDFVRLKASAPPYLSRNFIVRQHGDGSIALRDSIELNCTYI